jgi:hypothetical protein
MERLREAGMRHGLERGGDVHSAVQFVDNVLDKKRWDGKSTRGVDRFTLLQLLMDFAVLGIYLQPPIDLFEGTLKFYPAASGGGTLFECFQLSLDQWNRFEAIKRRSRRGCHDRFAVV